MYMLTLVLEPM